MPTTMRVAVGRGMSIRQMLVGPIVIAVALMQPVLVPLTAATLRLGGASVAVIVRGIHDDSSVDNAVASAGGRVTRHIHVINGVAATVPIRTLPLLASAPGISEVSPDLPVHMQSMPNGYHPANDTGSLYNTTQITGAQAFWQAGSTGQGIDVAVLDSGLVPVNGLSAPGKVLYGPDLSFESQAPNLRYLDTFGHGTAMSSIIAGRDNEAVAGHYAGDTGDFIGMAPDARIVSVKVADAQGLTDVSQVLAGIDWIVQHHADPGMNIRVVSMSFGTDSYQSYLVDPLAYAAEIAWHSGIVVVAATGNAGWKTGVLDPASNPYVIAVGAADTQSTNSMSNDTVATFSAGGDGYRNPDLVAPGAHIAGLRDPGSTIDAANPQAVVAGRFFRGSGTSQATAVVAGAAALLLSRYPQLTPDQVKAMLTSSATPLAGSPSILQGAGELNLRADVSMLLPPVAVQTWVPSTGTGSLDGARGSIHLSWNGVTLQGETDIFGNPVNTGALATLLADGTAWNGGVFNGVAWTGAGWMGDTWESNSWSSNSWSSNSWSSNSWSSNSWSSNSWSSNSWSSSSWG